MSKNSRGNPPSISYDVLRRISHEKTATVHFIGIGGVSVYSLARLTALSGATVTGSDREENERTRRLSDLGIKIHIGQRAENLSHADLVVYSHAISEDNPELLEAKRLGIPTVTRAEYLGALMLDYRIRIGVSGSHGKSSTVAMLDCIFSYADREPTVLSGSTLPLGEPIRIGTTNLMIYEACEYKDSFLRFLPSIAIALNLELDHTDYFADTDAISASFLSALNIADRFVLINGDDENLRRISPTIKTRVITFGAGEGNDYHYSVSSFGREGFNFSVYKGEKIVSDFELNIPGQFNLYNATAAIATALECGIDPDTVSRAIKRYRGISGRLEYIGSRFGRPIYSDYAHHPTEIIATINAMRQISDRPITVVFKPHTYSRTKSLWSEFSSALSLADQVIVTDIYPAREDPIPGVTAETLAADICGAIYSPDDRVGYFIDSHTRGTILLMGAGNFDRIKQDIIINT